MKEKTIIVDFDGVLHWYRQGWRDGSIYDKPVPGAQAAMARLIREGFKVIVFSTRAVDRVTYGKPEKGQALAMEAWLHLHDFPTMEVWTEPGKPIGTAYIDDRAVRFEGDWRKTIQEAMGLVPWTDLPGPTHLIFPK